MKGKSIIASVLPFGGSRGERVSGARVYLVTGTDLKRIAFQKTGESGKVTFAHLDKGIYRILLDIPGQTGKLEAKEAWYGDFQVGYHSKKKLFLFQEQTGYFAVRFSKLENLADSNITPMYELEESRRKGRIMIGKIEIVHKFGGFTMELSAYSQKKFQKLTTKYKDDAGMSVITKSR